MVSHNVGVTVLPEGALRMLGGVPHGVARFGDVNAVRRMGLVYRASSSRGSDFSQLARIITSLAQDAGLPLTPVPSAAAR